MKKALSYKIILLFVVFALSFAAALGLTALRSEPVLAETVAASNMGNYFSGADGFEIAERSFNDGDYEVLVASLKKDGKHAVSINNKLVIDEFSAELVIPEAVSKFTVTLTYDSYFENGAYNAETEKFDSEIENEFVFENVSGLQTLTISTDNNVITVGFVGGGLNQTKTENYYKIQGDDKCVAKIAFDFTLSADAELLIQSISQKSNGGYASADANPYRQTFERENGNIKTVATPRVAINNMPMKKDGDALKVVYAQKYSLTFTAYSLFGGVSSSELYMRSLDADVILDPYSEKPTNVSFENESADAEFAVVRKVGDDVVELETFEVLQAVKRNADNAAPSYIDGTANQDVYEWYDILVKRAAKKEYFDSDDKSLGEHSIRLGDTYTVPSLNDLVEDDLNVYSDLSYTVYYRTPSSDSGSTTSLKFTVSEAGDYKFYVSFKDKNGNEMEKDDFYTVSETDDNDITFSGLVFSFTIEDDAPISVSAPKSQGKGYLNIKYTATEFDVQSSGNNVSYKLYYNPADNATADTDGWIALPLLSAITEEYNEDGFTYEDIKSLAYDGSYTFTPVKMGTYRIDCDVTSDNQVRSASASTFISVAEEPAVVKVDTHWFKNNIWSLVFLTIGTLSLIGIIVLLFIKPKEEIETDETGDALNVNAKK